MAIRSHEWVPHFLDKYEGKQCPQMANSAPSPPPFDMTAPITLSDVPNVDDGKFDNTSTAQFNADTTKTVQRNTDDRTCTKLGAYPDGKYSAYSIEPQGAAAWLACWSICRMLAHVQIVPAFLGTHRSDAICWVR